MSKFNAKASRAKRPCPLWVDAFQRDTQHLEADEVGAYMLILMAMWTRESCDFPADAKRLARVSRVSTRLWNSRIGEVIMDFFEVEDGAAISKRLRKEATYTERQVTQQSSRKKGENSDKPLKTNEPPQTVDEPRNDPRDYPTQLPNYPTEEGGGGSAGASEKTTFRENCLVAMGHDPSGITAAGRIAGNPDDMRLVAKWQAELGLNEVEVCAVIAETVAGRTEPPPTSFKYFTEPMRRFAGAKSAEPLAPSFNPTTGDQNDPSDQYPNVSSKPNRGRYGSGRGIGSGTVDAFAAAALDLQRRQTERG